MKPCYEVNNEVIDEGNVGVIDEVNDEVNVEVNV